jgi:hypothetical protein
MSCDRRRARSIDLRSVAKKAIVTTAVVLIATSVVAGMPVDTQLEQSTDERPKVDIVLVFDRSESMDMERYELARALPGLHDRLVRDMGGKRFMGWGTYGPVVPKPLDQTSELRGLGKRRKIAIAALQDGVRAAQTMPGQQGAFQPELAGPAEMEAFGVGTGGGEFQQADATQAGKPQGADQAVDVEAV